MSFLISKSIRALCAMNRPSRLHINQRIHSRLFSDKSDDVKSPTAENTNPGGNIVDNEKLGSFAKAFEKYTKPQEEVEPVAENLPFSRLLRESKFVDVCAAEWIMSNDFDYIRQTNSYPFSLTVGRPKRKNCFGENRYGGRKRFVYWFWLEIWMHLHETGARWKVSNSSAARVIFPSKIQPFSFVLPAGTTFAVLSWGWESMIWRFRQDFWALIKISHRKRPTAHW